MTLMWWEWNSGRLLDEPNDCGKQDDDEGLFLLKGMVLGVVVGVADVSQEQISQDGWMVASFLFSLLCFASMFQFNYNYTCPYFGAFSFHNFVYK